MTVAVTGASGHIGNNLCRELIRRGYKVRVLINKDNTAVKGLDIEIVKGNISNIEALYKLTDNADIVFHLAAIISISGNSIDYLSKVNVQGTKNIIDASIKQKVKKFIHFSSIHALNQFPLEKELTEKNQLADGNCTAYDQTKADAERLVLKAVENGLDAHILNPTSVLGINDFKSSLVGQAFLKIANGKLPALIPAGFNWVDVRDIVYGAIESIEKGVKGERYLLSGHWKTLEDLATEINKYSKRKNPIKIPFFLAKIGVPFIYIFSKMTGNDPLYTYESLNILKESNKNISYQKAKEYLAYSPKKFEDTIKDTFEWYKKQGLIKIK